MVAGRVIQRRNSSGELTAAQSFFIKGEDAPLKHIVAPEDVTHLLRRRGSASLASTSSPALGLSGSFRLAKGEPSPVESADVFPPLSAISSFRRRSMISRTPTPERKWMEAIALRSVQSLQVPDKVSDEAAESGVRRSSPERHAGEEHDILRQKAAHARAIYRQLSHTGNHSAVSTSETEVRSIRPSTHTLALPVKTRRSSRTERPHVIFECWYLSYVMACDSMICHVPFFLRTCWDRFTNSNTRSCCPTACPVRRFPDSSTTPTRQSFRPAEKTVFFLTPDSVQSLPGKLKLSVA